MQSRFILFLGSVLLCGGLIAGEHYQYEETRQHEAHQHGHAKMSIAAEGQELLIELHSPAHNVLGFEYQPKTRQQHKKVKQSIATLKNVSGLVAIPESAGCILAEVEIDSPFIQEHDYEEKHEHEEKHDSVHSEFEVSYLFKCRDNNKLNKLDFAGLFSKFEGFEEIDTQWIVKQKQSSKELTVDDSVIDF